MCAVWRSSGLPSFRPISFTKHSNPQKTEIWIQPRDPPQFLTVLEQKAARQTALWLQAPSLEWGAGAHCLNCNSQGRDGGGSADHCSRSCRGFLSRALHPRLLAPGVGLVFQPAYVCADLRGSEGRRLRSSSALGTRCHHQGMRPQSMTQCRKLDCSSKGKLKQQGSACPLFKSPVPKFHVLWKWVGGLFPSVQTF